eukprot:6470406-Alexandrium_andersonii.AAC.1
MLLAAARHYVVWNNAQPRFTVHGGGSEATIIMHSTRPGDLPPFKCVSLGSATVAGATAVSSAPVTPKTEDGEMDGALGAA